MAISNRACVGEGIGCTAFHALVQNFTGVVLHVQEDPDVRISPVDPGHRARQGDGTAAVELGGKERWAPSVCADNRATPMTKVLFASFDGSSGKRLVSSGEQRT